MSANPMSRITRGEALVQRERLASCELAPGISLPRRRILGITIADVGRATAIAALETALRNGQFVRLAFCNAHTANLAHEDIGYRQHLEHFLVLPDGIGVDLASTLLFGQPFADNLNGTDFVPLLIRSLATRQRIRLIGARAGVAERAARALQDLAPWHDIAVLADGYQSAAAEAVLLANLETDPPDIVLVALGNPLQEDWIVTRLDERHAKLAIGVGALFDFLAGEVTRAPKLMRTLRLEWLFRLINEPKRLFYRYVIGNPKFLWRVLRQWAKPVI